MRSIIRLVADMARHTRRIQESDVLTVAGEFEAARTILKEVIEEQRRGGAYAARRSGASRTSSSRWATRWSRPGCSRSSPPRHPT